MSYTFADIEERVRKNINSDVADVSIAIDNAIDFLGNFYENHKIDESISTVKDQEYIDKPALCKEIVKVEIAEEDYAKITPSKIEEAQDFELKRFVDYNDKIQIYPIPTAVNATKIWYKSFFTPLEGVAEAVTDVPNSLVPLLVSIATWFFLEQQENMYDYVGADGWLPVEDEWTYLSNVDDPTFTITVPAGATSKYSVGMKIKLTQTTVKFFIITKVENTKLTVYGGTDYDLTDAIISQIYFSTAKSPLNFPMNPAKWTVEVTDITQRPQASPVANQWYNTGSIQISLPIGLWNVEYVGGIFGNATSSGAYILPRTTLSTANNSETDPDFTSFGGLQIAFSSAITEFVGYVQVNAKKILNIAAKTTYYFNFGVMSTNNNNVILINDQKKLIIKAVCAYL